MRIESPHQHETSIHGRYRIGSTGCPRFYVDDLRAIQIENLRHQRLGKMIAHIGAMQFGTVDRNAIDEAAAMLVAVPDRHVHRVDRDRVADEPLHGWKEPGRTYVRNHSSELYDAVAHSGLYCFTNEHRRDTPFFAGVVVVSVRFVQSRGVDEKDTWPIFVLQ